jgi:4-hydroxy 2-oxovalerate aldolase
VTQAKRPRTTDKEKKIDSWVTYRPQIKIFDCTIRDGGLMNNHRFEDAFIKRVFETLCAAGVDYMEFGYKADRKIFAPEEHGAWKFCSEDDLRRMAGDGPLPLKLSVMADAERTDYHQDILPRDKSILSCIRVAAYVNQIPAAVDMLKDAHEKGYETTFNLMAVSAVQDRELDDALAVVARSCADVVYLVDSFGSLYSEQIRALTRKYLRALDGTGKQVGIHTHNNQQLAYANTVEALIVGATWLDATICGLGRGAGNCPLELLLGFLKNPKFHLRPVIQCVEELLEPLRGKLDWGYSIPYLITGMLNQHPRAAIKLREGATPDKYVAFYDQMVQEE